MRIYGNLGGEVPGGYVLSPGDIPDTTIKETTLYKPNGFIGNQVENAAYIVSEQQPIANQRDTTNHDQLLGVHSKYGNRQYDNVYRQTNSEAKEKSIAGRTNYGNAKHFNPNINVTLSRLDSDRDNTFMGTISCCAEWAIGTNLWKSEYATIQRQLHWL